MKKTTNKIKKVKTSGEAFVQVSDLKSGAVVSATHTKETLPDVITDGQPVIVVYKKGETINKGNFSSTRIDIGLHLPCSMAQIDATYDIAAEWVEARLKIAILSSQPSISTPSTLNEDHPF